MKFLHYEDGTESVGNYVESRVDDETSRVVYALHGKKFGLVLWNSHHTTAAGSPDPHVVVSMARYDSGPLHNPTFISSHTVAASAVPELLDMLGDAAQWLEKNCERTDGVWRVK